MATTTTTAFVPARSLSLKAFNAMTQEMSAHTSGYDMGTIHVFPVNEKDCVLGNKDFNEQFFPLFVDIIQLSIDGQKAQNAKKCVYHTKKEVNEHNDAINDKIRTYRSVYEHNKELMTKLQRSVTGNENVPENYDAKMKEYEKDMDDALREIGLLEMTKWVWRPKTATPKDGTSVKVSDINAQIDELWTNCKTLDDFAKKYNISLSKAAKTTIERIVGYKWSKATGWAQKAITKTDKRSITVFIAQVAYKSNAFNAILKTLPKE